MSLLDEGVSTFFKTNMDVFTKLLSSLVIVDIGYITSVNGGRAVVETNQYVGDNRVVYKNVEVVYPGNGAGVFSTVCSNSPCLIFIPRTCTTDVNKHLLKPHAVDYSLDGIKCIPIGNGTGSIVNLSFDSVGNLLLQTKAYQLLFEEPGFSLQVGNNLTVSINAGGSIAFHFKGEDTGPTDIEVSESGVSVRAESTDGSVLWTGSLTPEGQLNLDQQFGDDDDSHNTLVFNADGSVSNTVGGDYSIETKGNLSLKGANVTIESTGDNSSVDINNGNMEIKA